MLKNLSEFSEQVRTCLQLAEDAKRSAEDAKRKAEQATHAAPKIHFLKMETRWLSLARSYELTGVIAANLERRGQSEVRVRAGERPEPRKVVEEGRVDTISQLVWLASIVETGDDAITSIDPDGIMTSWNKGAERLFGYSAEQAIGQPATILIPSEYQDEYCATLNRVRCGHTERCETVRRRKDGSLIDVSLTVSPMRGDRGKIVGISKVARDITERRRSEAQISVLSREAEHRSKNLLANVKAMVRLSQSDTPGGLKNAIEGRIDALANVHSLFVQSRWAGAELGSLVKQELSPYSGGGGTRTLINGPTVMLKPDAAQAMAMALHELATNATKYGALSVTTGQVRVEWSQVENGELILRWTEAGGPPVNPPTRRGFGIGVMESMIRDGMDGRVQLDWRAEGLTCEIAVPTLT